MAKVGEINYMRKLGERGRWHAINKPFSDPNCPSYFVELGAIFGLLPPPPLRVLDIGCGTGWTSRFFARRGYQVLGVDICPEMIEAARTVNEREELPNLEFQVCDYETMTHVAEFDIAVFYDALHHSVDEEAALRMAYQALKPGGICITSEPGRGHASSAHSQHAMAEYNVTEKDMPPGRIIRAARRVGFRKSKTYPHAFDLSRLAYQGQGRVLNWIPRWLGPIRKLAVLLQMNLVCLLCRFRSGIVVLQK